MSIEIKNVSKKISNISILEDINISLNYGRIYGFIGRNGSGKTMLLNVLCGFMKPNTGSVTIDDVDIYEKGVFPDNVRALIEKPKFLGNVSGYKNLELLASIKNTITRADIEKTLEEVNLSSDKDKLYKKYSLGMKQKLGIAQVLMENPNIMIFDEPFNGLDDQTASKIRQILLNKKSEGKLIIVVTHIREDIENLCDEIYQMDGGRIAKK